MERMVTNIVAKMKRHNDRFISMGNLMDAIKRIICTLDVKPMHWIVETVWYRPLIW